MTGIHNVKYVFTLAGAVMLIGAFLVYKNTRKFIERSIEVEGTVTELSTLGDDNSTTYTPLVQFKDTNGTQVEFQSTASNSYAVNDRLLVLYNPENPHKAKTKSFYSLWGGVIILGAFGLIFFTLGGRMIANTIKKKNLLKYLKQHGTKISTDFQHANLDTSFAINGKSPFVIVSQWKNPKTDELHVFRSDNIWFNPNAFIKTDEIAVFIDRKNPTKYVVDLSFLPKLAE